MMFSSAGLFLMATCVFEMASQSTISTQELPACDKRFPKLRTVACRKEIKTPLVKAIFSKTNIQIYNCDFEAIANTILHFNGRYRWLFPNINVTKYLVFKENITKTASFENKAGQFVAKAIDEWSKDLEEIKIQKLRRVGCNFFLNEYVGNGNYGYELCCAFN
ncbi:hypothetical protein ANCCAN_13926 [Ancylostoma caninum]|uniref:SCP domain-containing protein n=1 Tax=Ancylostoma caninum TaxID=29170 RepID=A0A368GAX1_ANCCA|nr:hypothetical protein ANCCAN_13926 [Ancylostoma caninum]